MKSGEFTINSLKTTLKICFLFHIDFIKSVLLNLFLRLWTLIRFYWSLEVLFIQKNTKNKRMNEHEIFVRFSDILIQQTT